MTVVHEHIRHFEISVNNIFLSKVIKSFEDIPDDWLCSILVKVSHFSETRLEVSLIAKLSYDITIAIAGEYFEASEDVGVIKFLENIDFWEEKFF